MRRLSTFAAGLALASLGLAGCSESGSRAEAAGAPEAAEPGPPTAVAAAPVATATPEASVEDSAGPAFAETYPGAEIEQAALSEADGTDGGLMVFTTEAAPEQVIAFYKGKAEAAGLSPTMAMAQGDTHAYGAAHPQTGATLSVVASPDGERTSVQLSWSGATVP
ncbi:MAG TPA: hypothetical protein VGN74_00125 [Brevundimonas sp.]|jgi:hypothetical protein|uniref:hypothetical protein n=1 Tax=Brevundimonas sp. TaxID=1871086 RepID=UPI002E1277AB|nr:hypothetical protein [Brevundimonas sp.]